MSTFRKINNWLHLWLGLISGIIMFIVCITGCLWVFHEEITDLLEPENRVEVQKLPVLPPSALLGIATETFPGKQVTFANYRQGRAVEVGVGKWTDEIRYTLKVHPYTGQVLSQKSFGKDETDFFRWAINGHRFLWLDWEIGRPIVNYGTLVFVIILITGLIWWYPKKWTKATRDKSFKIKWGAGWKRINLDFHNVLGFYSMLVLLVLALTGMVYGIEWYSKSLYWSTSGGESMPEWPKMASDSTRAGQSIPLGQAMDGAWGQVLKKHPEAQGFYYAFPDTTDAKSVVSMYVYPTAGKYYDMKNYHFDRHTLRAFDRDPFYEDNFADASFGTRLRRMNFDLHVGSILGFPGKVLAFFASLIGASLPVTGFIIWWVRGGYKFRKKKAPKQRNPEKKNVVRPTRTPVSAFTPSKRPQQLNNNS